MMPPIGTPRNKTASYGFTLVELLLLLVLMASILGLAVTNFSGVFGGMELRKSTDDLASLMRYAQARSIAERVTLRVIFEDDFRRYRLQQVAVDEDGQEGEFQNISHRLGRPVVFPRDVEVDSETPEIKFYPDGTLDRVRVRLKSKNKQRTLSSMEQRGYVFVLDE